MNIKRILAIGAVVLIVIYGINGYNNLVQLEENVKQRWSQVENQYQRRADLIPNLVNTVQGAADFEKETLTQVIEARSKASSIQMSPEMLENPEQMQQFQQAQGALSGALSRLMVRVERYPKLQANQNFRDLQSQLEGTENRIAVERDRFNRSAEEYNSTIRQFPTNLLAGIGGFDTKAYFEADQGAEEAPEVQF